MYILPRLLIVSTVLCACDLIADHDSGSKNFELTALWEYEFDMAGFIRASPIVIGDSALAMVGDTNISLLDIDNGKKLWSSRAEVDRSVSGVKLLADNRAVYSYSVDNLSSWDLQDGSRNWKLEYDDQFQVSWAHRIDQSNQFIFGGDNRTRKMFYLDKSGSIKYSKKIEYQPHTSAYHSGILYVTQREHAQPNDKGRITAFDVASRDSLWSFETGKGGFLRIPPIIENGVLYSGTVGSPGAFYALDAETGEMIWEYDRPNAFNGALGVYSAILIGDVIYFNDGLRVNALDKHTGDKLWQTHMEAGTSRSTGFAYMDGYLYKPHNTGMRILDAETGEIVHIEWPPDGTYFWGVSASSDRIFAQTSTQLIAYEPFGKE